MSILSYEHNSKLEGKCQHYFSGNKPRKDEDCNKYIKPYHQDLRHTGCTVSHLSHLALK